MTRIYGSAVYNGDAYIEALLRAELFDEQDLRNAELGPYVRHDLAVDKVLLEADMAPHCPFGSEPVCRNKMRTFANLLSSAAD